MQASPRPLGILIAHSHGGNVALYAIRQVPDVPALGVGCISTPFLHAGLRGIHGFDADTWQGRSFGLISLVILFTLIIWIDRMVMDVYCYLHRCRCECHCGPLSMDF